MKIASFLKVIVASIVIAFTLPTSTNAMNNINGTAPVSDSAQDAKVFSRIVLRVTEIQNMDKTNLTSTERKALKKELREMKETAGGLDQRVYLSVGAIIIIILLLILIL
jgi:hypothetical protein